MRTFFRLRLAAAGCLVSAALFGQNPPFIIPVPVEQPKPQQQPNQPNQQQQNQQQQPARVQPRISDTAPFLLNGVSLTEMIDLLAKELKINFILDPKVNGAVTLYTYGEIKSVELMPLLQTILRVNHATMVQVGDLWHIVPIASISNLPLPPVMNADPKTLPDDERMILNLVFLKYATAAEMDKLLSPFYGEGAGHSVYEPANLIIMQDNSRSMKRTMQLIELFDSDTFATQRVRLFEITNSRPTDIAKELDTVFKAYSLSEKSGVRFIPVDRINTLIGVAPNAGIFAEVQKWIDKLDIPVKVTAGATTNYVYRLKYARSDTVAMAIMALYSGNIFALSMLAQMSQSPIGGIGGGGGMYGGGGYGGGMYGGGGYGGGMYGGGGFGGGMYGGGGYGGGMYGGGYGNPYGGGGYGGMGIFNNNNGAGQAPISVPSAGTATTPTPGVGDTGAYLGSLGGGGMNVKGPHVIPNPFDNTLLVQGTPQEWEQIQSLLHQLDVPPRQVLIDAKIYELDLTGAFSAGVQAYLQKVGTTNESAPSRVLSAASGAGGATLSLGALVLRSHELLGVLSLAESTNQSRIIQSPSIIATDSIPAVMNVGQDVPVLQSSGTAVTGSSFNSVSNRSTGVTLQITARVNSSGIVTMQIDQDVSAPQGNSSSSIDSPAFSRRSFSTQVTVSDGDTIAIGGFIGETHVNASSGVPLLHRIPLLGAAFGSKSISKSRTELVIFLTPRVIYDTNAITDATDEIKTNLKKLQKSFRDQQ